MRCSERVHGNAQIEVHLKGGCLSSAVHCAIHLAALHPQLVTITITQRLEVILTNCLRCAVSHFNRS